MKALRADNFRALCAECGLSAKTGSQWRERLLRRGVEGMAEEARRPHQHPEQLSPEVVCAMVRLQVGLTRFDGHLGGGALTESADEQDQDR